MALIRRGGAGPRRALPALGVALAALFFAWMGLAPFGRRYASHLTPNLQDPLFCTYLLTWCTHQTTLGFPDYWNAGFYYPEPDVLALSEHLIGPGLLAAAAAAAGWGPVASYNLLLLLSFPLCALSVYVLLRRAGLRRASAALGAWAVAFSPFRWMHLEHFQILWVPFLALVIVAWDRLLERATPGRAAIFLGTYALHLSGGLYFAYMVHLALLALVVARWRGVSRQLAHAFPRRTLLATGLATSILAYLDFAPYLAAAARGYRRTEGDMAVWGATLVSFLTPSRLDRYFPEGLQGWYRFENALFPGIAIVLAVIFAGVRSAPRARVVLSRIRRPILAGVGVSLALAAVVLADLTTWTGRESVSILGWSMRIRGYSRPALLLVAGLALVLSASGWRWRRRTRAVRGSPALFRCGLRLQGVAALALCLPLIAAPASRFVPGLSGIRVPSRFFQLALLAGGLALGAAASLAARRLAPRWRGAAIVGLGLLLLAPELLPRRVDWWPVERPKEFPRVYQEMATRGLEGAVAELPLAEGIRRSDILRMWRSTLSWNPTSAGYSGYEPNVARSLRELQAHGSAAQLVRQIRGLGFAFLLLHERELPEHVRVARSRELEAAVLGQGGEEVWSGNGDRLLALSRSGHP